MLEAKVRYIKLLLIAVALGVLLWLTRRRGEYIEYPEQPEPLQPWWNVTSTYTNGDGVPITWTTIPTTLPTTISIY